MTYIGKKEVSNELPFQKKSSFGCMKLEIVSKFIEYIYDPH